MCGGIRVKQSAVKMGISSKEIYYVNHFLKRNIKKMHVILNVKSEWNDSQ